MVTINNPILINKKAWFLSDDSAELQYSFIPKFSTLDSRNVMQYFENLSALSLPKWNFYSSFGWLWAPIISLGSEIRGVLFVKRPTELIKMALDEEKFQLLIGHIDRYIDATIGQKFEQNNQIIMQETNEKVAYIVANSIMDALENFHYQLVPQDMDMIVTKIQGRIATEFTEKEKSLLGKMSINSDDQVVKIEEIFKQNLNLRVNEIKLGNENVDLSQILASILKSKKLHVFIDGLLQPAFDRLGQQDVGIDAIKSDVANLKLNIMNHFAKFEKDIKLIKTEHQNLGDDFFKFKLDNNEILQKLLVEIDTKLVSFGESQFTSIDANVRKNLLNILGFDYKSENGGMMDGNAIKNWITSMFVAKSYLEERLSLVEANGDRAFQLQLDKNAGILMNEINNEISRQITNTLTAKAIELDRANVKISGGLSEADVLKIVKGVLEVYDADKTGLVDFALESAGGQVLSTRCTENYQTKSAEISVFGIPLWYPSNTPRTVISPSIQPGECWAFQGFPGFIVVQLNNLVQLSGFTMEHIPQSLAPNGVIDSAPNNFTVWGLLTEMDKEPVHFGSYHYSAVKGAPSLQYFPVQNSEVDQPYQIIELRVESNHGNPKYTCLYRFRVHGSVVKQ